MKLLRRILLPSSALVMTLVLAGCTMQQTAVSPAFDGAAVRGVIHGGQPPVVGAHVYLMAANNTGYGSASVPIVQSGAGVASDGAGTYVTTDASGGFVLGTYSCTSGQQLVYLLATGGNPGNPGSTQNPALSMMAALGKCPSGGNFATATPFVYVNEVSTVSTAYALSGYITDGTHVSSPNTANALTGIGNAFATVANMEDLATGTARATTPNGNGTVSQSTMNALADILAPCVNSDGTVSGCTTLFANAMSGSATPQDTATAMVNIAHHPGSNVGTLFGLVGSSPPYPTSLSSAPNDLTVSVVYTGGGMSQDSYAAADALGNVWVMGQASGISLFNNLGVAQSSSALTTGLQFNSSLALDTAGEAFVSGYQGSPVGVVKVSPGLTASGVTNVGNMGTPESLVFDGTANIYAWNFSAENFGGVTTLLTANVPTGNLAGATIGSLATLAIDNAGFIWTTGTNPSAFLQKFAADGTYNLSATTGFSYPLNLAIDSSNQVWVADLNNGNLDGFTSNGAPLTNSPFTGGGLGVTGPPTPTANNLAIDGDGNVWASAVTKTANISNSTFSYTEVLAEFSNAGVAKSPTTGYQASSLITPVVNQVGYPLAIDNSGNIWVANFGTNSLTQFVGLAAPVYGPLTPGHLGARP